MQDTVSFDVERNRLRLIDQTRLPHELKILELHTIEEMEMAIAALQVRGAPAIGVAAAIGLAVLARESKLQEDTYEGQLRHYAERLNATRPTAVNLSWALTRMLAGPHDPESLASQALTIWREDIETCRSIGLHGSTLLQDGDCVLTHCNAGRLAAVRYGTALAPIYVAAEQGKRIHVFADETRPLLQGARLTAYELTEAGIPVTLLCDSMAASLLQSGRIQAVFIGADRIARNGDTANKIGSLGLSLAAQTYGIPFYVCAPMSTVDFDCPAGVHIPIEQRAPEEVTQAWYRERMAPASVQVHNPAFDVVPCDHITAFITERGILKPQDLSKQSPCNK